MEIESGSLSCDRCRRDYEISEGIPRFVPIELSEKVKLNVNNFGYEWSWLSSISEKNEIEFRSYLGEILPEGFASRVVLDAGCGMGKFLYFTGKYGAKDAIGVDLASGSVERAYKNTMHLENVHVVQADLLHLPLKRCFDFIYSIGVLHHLAQPEQGFYNLVEYLKSNGKIFALLKALKANDGDQKKKLFQFLNDIGARALRMQLGRVLEMCESSASKGDYEAKIVDRFGGQRELDFVPLPSSSSSDSAQPS